MINLKLKNEKGAIGTDAFISILVITLFVGLIATLTYNIYITTMKTKRTSQATSYIVEIFEYVDKLYYSDVTEEKLVDYVNEKYNNTEISETNEKIASARNTTNLENTDDTKNILETPYKIEIAITPYNENLDIVKTITVTVKYNLASKEETLTMSRVRAKENLITPNEPDINSLAIEDSGKNIYPIKYNGGYWYVTNNQNDTAWYNYESGYWATIFVTNEEFEEGNIVPITSLGEYYVWIPRYAHNDSEIKFLYGNTEPAQYVNEQGNLEELPDGYTISNERMDKNI